ncbi:hypothetical protein ACVDFE_22915 [Lentzea chajnantorensis]
MPVGPAWLVVPIFFAVASLGFVLGPATALALDAVPQAAGTGSAVLGASQFGLAAVVSPLVSAREGHSAVPMAVTIAVLATIAAGFCALLGRAARRADVPEAELQPART